MPGIRLSEEELDWLNKSTKNAFTIPQEAGEGYLGTLKIFQLLHCLDELRKASYRDFYPELQSDNMDFDEAQWHAETDHCIDMLRVSLMCDSDVSVLPFNKNSTGKALQADFTSVKKCRDMDNIVEWSNSVSNSRMVPWDKLHLQKGS